MGPTIFKKLSINCMFILLVTYIICGAFWMKTIEARYLPTRGQSDGLDRLRDLLRDILETDSSNTIPQHLTSGSSSDRYPSSSAGISPSLHYDGLIPISSLDDLDAIGQQLQKSRLMHSGGDGGGGGGGGGLTNPRFILKRNSN